MKFVWVADPQISPDGSQVAFVRVDVNEKADTYDTSIWIVNTTGTDGPRRLTGSTATARRAGHLTDGTWPSRGRLRRTAVSCRRRSTSSRWHGGKPGPSPTSPGAPATPSGHPTAGRSRSRRRPSRPISPQSRRRRSKDRKAAARQSDVRVITEAVYRANGVPGFGYVDRDRPAQIWTTSSRRPALTCDKPVPVTTGEFAAGNVAWSADGSQIYFVSDRRTAALLPSRRQRPLRRVEGRRRAEGHCQHRWRHRRVRASRRTGSASRSSAP